MIDVGDDGDITNVGAAHFASSNWRGFGNRRHGNRMGGWRGAEQRRWLAGGKIVNSSTIGAGRVRRNLGDVGIGGNMTLYSGLCFGSWINGKSWMAKLPWFAG